MHGLDATMILLWLGGAALLALAVVGGLAWFGFKVWQRNNRR